jgi:recombination protein RecT
MENELVAKAEGSAMTKFRSLLSQDVIKKKFEEALGKKAPMFVSNLTTIMSGSAELQKCDQMSVISSALMAASMDLPLTPGLGFAGIVPYFDGPSQLMKAQFQVMKKGFIQLAQRTGLFKIINVSEVYEGELKSHNKFTGEYIFDETGKKSDNVIGYVSYFRLINGFEKYYYMPIEKLDIHAKRYSKSFQRGKGKWTDKEEGGYEQMCEKTVLKLNLSTYAPLSVDINMMNAIVYDQAEIRDVEGKDFDYVDNEESHKLEEKDTITTEAGKTIIVNKTDASKSEGRTTRATSKINPDKFADNKNIQDAEIIPSIPVKEEPPIKANRGSGEYMNGVKVIRDEAKNILNQDEIEKGDTSKDVFPEKKAGAFTEGDLMDMKVEDLLKIVNDDMDMMEAMNLIPGKNTNKKLRGIILAHQEERLTEYTAPFLDKETGEIKDDKMNTTGEPTIFGEPSGTADIKPLEKKGGNKYNIEVPEFDKGQSREFSTTKSLFNKLMGVEPQITTPRYMTLAEKLGLLTKYPDKETFVKLASTSEINLLLNSN